MKSNKLLVLVIALLLVSNIVLVYLLVFGAQKKQAKKERPDPTEIMIREVGMNKEQAATHKQLKDEHFKNVRPFYDSLRAAKAAYFGLIKDTAASAGTMAAYRGQIAYWQTYIDSMTFAHFRKMRGILATDQQPKYDEFVQKLMQRKKDTTAPKK